MTPAPATLIVPDRLRIPAIERRDLILWVRPASALLLREPEPRGAGEPFRTLGSCSRGNAGTGSAEYGVRVH